MRFFNAVNIPHWNVSQLQRDVLMLSQVRRQTWPDDRRRGDRCWWILRSFLEEERRRWQLEGSTLAARGHKTQRGGWRDHSETKESKNNSEQLFKIGEKDGIVVTGTKSLEQIYNLIDDDIKTHTHAQVSEKCAKINPREADFFLLQDRKQTAQRKK